MFLVLFYTGNALIGFEFTNEVVGAAGIAMIHTIFNVFATLVLLPFTKGLEKLAYLTIPKTAEEQNQKEDVFVILDDRFLSSPAFAIEQCHSLANQMAKITHEGFLEAMTVLDEYSEEKIEDVIAKENIVDTYDDKLSAYLTKLSSQNLSYKDSLKVTSLLHCLTDFERISDHSINVVENAQQMYKEGAVFSKKAKEEMKVYSTALRDILERTTNAFVEGDEALARTVEPLEEVIDELNKTVKKNHMKRLRKGKCTIELGLVLSDLAMNYERVADHCSNIAVYMMQLEDTQLEEHSFTEQLGRGERRVYKTVKRVREDISDLRAQKWGLRKNMATIYIVEDDINIREIERYALKNSGYEVEEFEGSASFFKRLEKNIPSLILLDIMLPGEDGLDILTRIRADKATADVPVIMVTAKTSELDKVKGLDLGADDYITKPFGVMELISRVKALLRRTSRINEDSQLIHEDILMDMDKHAVTVAGQLCELTFKEFELLKYLMLNQGIVLSRDKIMDQVWGFEYEGESRTVDMHIKTLRQKLGAAGSCIKTVRNVGYMIE